jgi:hypothetical protein
MTSTVNLQAVMAFWAAHLGCSEIQLAQPSTSVVRNGPDLASYRGATVVLRPRRACWRCQPTGMSPSPAG